jgi:dynein heavy chain 1
MKPDQALKLLQVFDTKFSRLREERENMSKAKDALELRDASSSGSDVKIGVSVEELQDLKGVWSALATVNIIK